MSTSKSRITVARNKVAEYRESIEMQTQVYLSRLRGSVAFPCSGRECYFGLMPALIDQLWGSSDTKIHTAIKPGRSSNLISTMSRGYQNAARTYTHTAQQQPQAIVHVSLDTADKYEEALDRGGGYERVFWVAVSPDVPTPSDPKQPFFLPEDHPHYSAIVEWYEAASKIESELQAAFLTVRRYSSVIKTAMQIKSTWPALLSVVTLQNSVAPPQPTHVTHKLKERLQELIAPGDMDTTTTLLARAVMMPENYALTAWVNYRTGASNG